MRILSMLLLLTVSSAMAQTREEIVRGDRKKVEAAGFWMYNDIPGAFAAAEKSGKPMIVVLRCHHQRHHHRRDHSRNR